MKLADGTEDVGLGRLVREHVAEVDVVGDELGEGVVGEQIDRAVEPHAKAGAVELASLGAHLVPVDVDLLRSTHRSNSAFARARSNASGRPSVEPGSQPVGVVVVGVLAGLDEVDHPLVAWRPAAVLRRRGPLSIE